MDEQGKPSPRLAPLPADHSPDLKDSFEAVARNLGFVPNSLLILQRKPQMVKAFAQMAARRDRCLPDAETLIRQP